MHTCVRLHQTQASSNQHAKILHKNKIKIAALVCEIRFIRITRNKSYYRWSNVIFNTGFDLSNATHSRNPILTYHIA